MSDSIEKRVYDFLVERVAAISDPANPLFEAELLKDEFEEIKKTYGIRIGTCTARIAPNAGQTAVEHYDAVLTLIFYMRIGRTEKQDRAPRRDLVIGMAETAAMFFFNDPEMGGRVKNSRPLTIPRGNDNTDASPYAVANVQLVVNETGTVNF